MKFVKFTKRLNIYFKFVILTTARVDNCPAERQITDSVVSEKPWSPCSSIFSPFLRSLSGGSVGCRDSSSMSWVTASLWGLGTSRFSIPQSPSASSCPWEAWASILSRETRGLGRASKRSWITFSLCYVSLSTCRNRDIYEGFLRLIRSFTEGKHHSVTFCGLRKGKNME